MEYYFFLTGNIDLQNFFLENLKSQSFNLAVRDALGSPQNQGLYGIVEPIQLFRYIFPEESLPIVAKTLNADAPNPLYDQLKLPLWTIRKALGLKPVPKSGLPNVQLPVRKEHLQIISVGVKEDPKRVMARSGAFQEAL